MLDPVQRNDRRRPSPRAQLQGHHLVLTAFALLAVADAVRGRWVSAVAHTIVVLLQLATLS